MRPHDWEPGQLIRPYGDRRDDGVVQLSFVLPVPPGERAREAAGEVAKKMGLDQVHVAAMEAAAERYTFFVVYGRTAVTVDYSKLQVPEVVVRKKGFDELNAYAHREVGRRIVVLGACTGSDAHTVGIDAIMNMKGYNGHKGLESYHQIRAINLGAQVDSEDLVTRAIEERADVILVSQVVTQKNIHLDNLTRLADILEAEGLRERVILVVGGPRISHELAKELGYDAGFGAGSYAEDVASFAIHAWTQRQGASA
jgi:beta-lysine 5,6-aminomutase beta subunit